MLADADLVSETLFMFKQCYVYFTVVVTVKVIDSVRRFKCVDVCENDNPYSNCASGPAISGVVRGLPNRVPAMDCHLALTRACRLGRSSRSTVAGARLDLSYWSPT